MKSTHLCALALVATLTACGGVLQGPFESMDPLRRHALAHPDDKRSAELLALGELFHANGDPTRAEDALLRAKELDPQNVKVTFLLGVWSNLHGRPSEALGHFISALRLGLEGPEAIESRRVAELSVRLIESLSERVPRFLEVIAPALEETLERPMAADLRLEINLLLARANRRGGHAERAEEIAQRAGCISTWRVAGPFSRQPMLGFEDSFAPDDTPALSGQYVLGNRDGMQPTRDHASRVCTVQLGSGQTRSAGVTFAEATREIPTGGRYLVHLASANPAELFLDGESVLQLDPRIAPAPLSRGIVLTLAAGSHRLRVRVASRHPNPAVAVAVAPQQDESDPQGADAATPLDDLASLYIEAHLTFLRGNPVKAREQLRDRFAAGPGGAAPLLPQYLLAFLTLADPYRSVSTRQNEGRRWFESIVDLERASFVAPLQLARMTQSSGRSREAIEALRTLHERLPHVDAVTANLATALLQEGWATEADRILEDVAESESVSCMMMGPLFESAEQQGHWDEAEAWARRSKTCAGGEQRLFSLLLQRRKTSEAQHILDRMVATDAPDQRSSWLSTRQNLARTAGDNEAVGRAVAERLQAEPWSLEASVQGVDWHLAQGERGTALRLLDERVQQDPSSQGGLLLLRDFISTHPLLAEHRVDGAEVVKEFEASDTQYDAPEIMVLDHTVIQVFEDGSAVELTHNIWKIQSEGAADARGEYSAPAGAHLLQLHTLVPESNGETRRLEPEPIPGKDSYSLPALLPGRFVEVEYVVTHPSSPRLAGGYLGPRFFFQSLEESFDRSQLTMIVPHNAQLEIDARGGAPEPTESRSDTHRTLRWQVRESRAFLPEPNAVVPHEWLPSVNVGINANWAASVRYIRDLLADRDPVDPAAQRFVSQTLQAANAHTMREKAAALYRWVLDNIDENGDVFGLAPAMLYDRAGNRARVLRYLLTLAEVDAELWFARSVAEDASDSELPEPGRFRNLLVAVSDGAGTTIQLYTEDRFAPFGYLPMMLRGEPAIRLVAGAPSAVTATLSEDLDRRRIEIEMRISEDGSVVASFHENLHGALALRWRSDLSQIPEALLEDRFGQHYLPQMLPGGELTRLRIEGRERSDGPLTLEYEATHHNFARRQGDRLLLPYPFRSNLRAQYAPNANRRTTQLVAPGDRSEVRIRVVPAEGLRFRDVPTPKTLRGPGVIHASFSAEVGDDGVLELVERVRLPLTRVAPENYPAFVRFCQQVDTTELREVSLGN